MNTPFNFVTRIYLETSKTAPVEAAPVEVVDVPEKAEPAELTAADVFPETDEAKTDAE